MYRNYLKIAWRNLVKNKVYSVINVSGLAAGMAVAMLIAFWIWDEVTYDKSFANHQELAQVMTTFVGEDGSSRTLPEVCMPIGDELRSKHGSDFKNIAMTSWNFRHVLAAGDKKISGNGMWAEDKFPMMFSMNMLKGNINALTDPSSIIINASIAKTLFGDADPINKTIRLDNKDNYQVAGVFQDFPDNSTLYDSKYFLPWKKYITTEQWLRDAGTDWYNHSWQCFAQLADNVVMDNETEKIRNVVMAHKDAKTDGIERAYLFPMDKWHLYSEFKDGRPVGGRVQFVRLLSVIGIFVLLLACINFMNLSTARSEKRAKEVC